MKKKIKKWPFVLGIVVILVVCAFIFLPKLAPASSDTGTSSATLSATVTSGSIESTVVTSGNLTDAAIKVPFPYNVTVDKILVSPGDSVKKGDALATLDSSSLSSAISTAKSDLSDVNDNLASLANKDTDTKYVYAKATARVKKVYAKDGESAAKTVASKGYLLLLSMDEKMAVDIKSGKKVDLGESVTVTLPDGTTKDGTVATVAKGRFTVTLTDNGPKLDDKATVSKDGTKLGTGKLYVHSPMRIMNNTGTVESVYVSENSKVYSGSSLLRLKVPSVDTAAATLRTNQAWLQDLLEKLNDYAVTDTVTSNTDGTVGDIYVKAGGMLTNSGTMEPSSDGTANDRGTGFTINKAGDIAMLVSVDELDIAAVKKGESVSISMDAIEGKTFQGIVTDVSSTAVSDGNVSGYATTIALKKDSAMKNGMSATATIVDKKKDNVLIIPMDAVQQYGANVFVYTAKDKQGNLSGDTLIQTGLSDGTNVEVTSGLSAGQTVYYVSTSTSSSSQRNFMIGGGETRAISGGGGQYRNQSDNGGGQQSASPGQGG